MALYSLSIFLSLLGVSYLLVFESVYWNYNKPSLCFSSLSKILCLYSPRFAFWRKAYTKMDQK